MESSEKDKPGFRGINVRSRPLYFTSADLEERDMQSSVPVVRADDSRLPETGIPQASTKGSEQSLGPGTGSPAKALRHQCRFCPYATQHRGSLVLHERVHTGERPFRCHLCSREFAHRSHLMCHYCTHTGGRPYRFPLCPAAFSQRSNVKVHLRTHRLLVTSS